MVLLLSVPVAGCIEGPRAEGIAPASAAPDIPLPAAVRLVSDPRGDSHWMDESYATSVARAVCAFAAPEAACNAARDAVPRGVGTPGPPGLDILGVTLSETPQSVTFDLELASVDASLKDILPVEGAWVEFGVCWDTPDARCDIDDVTNQTWTENPYTVYTMTDAGAQQTVSEHFRMDPACGGDGICSTAIASELVPGAPGAVRFVVPRSLLPEGDAATSLEGVFGYASHGMRRGMTGPLLRGEGLGVGLSYTGSSFAFAHPDVTDRAPSYRFVTPPEPAVPVDDMLRFRDEAGEPLARDPQGDLFGAEVLETPETLTLSVALAEVRPSPFDHRLTVNELSFSHGAAATMTRTVTGGTVTFDAAVCLAAPCDTTYPLPVDISVLPGRPGFVNLTFAREDVGAPPRGTTFSEIAINLLATDMRETTAGPFKFGHGDTRALDRLTAPLLPPLRTDTPGPAEAPAGAAGRVTDGAGDVGSSGPVVIAATDRPTYDLRLVEAAAVAPGVIGLTLALENLVARPVPSGYDAVVYAAALELDAGAVMTYLVKSRDGPTAAYCAQDTLVFPLEPRDPSSALGTEIEEVVRAGGSGGDERGAAAGGGSITFLAPTECFGVASTEAVPVRRMGAGTYLIKDVPNAERQVYLLDNVTGTEAFTIDPVTAQALTPTFWQAPLGYENGWDILGAALAAVTVLGTLLLFWRRRRQLHLYLEAIVAIEAAHESDPGGRAEDLVRLRTRLHRDLVRHRVSDAHYSIILDRLRSRITSARLMSVGDRIYDVPTNLALRIERLLDDGRLTEEEHRALLPALGKARMPQETRTIVLDKLSRWAAEDAREGAA